MVSVPLPAIVKRREAGCVDPEEGEQGAADRIRFGIRCLFGMRGPVLPQSEERAVQLARGSQLQEELDNLGGDCARLASIAARTKRAVTNPMQKGKKDPKRHSRPSFELKCRCWPQTRRPRTRCHDRFEVASIEVRYARQKAGSAAEIHQRVRCLKAKLRVAVSMALVASEGEPHLFPSLTLETLFRQVGPDHRSQCGPDLSMVSLGCIHHSNSQLARV